ncbi:MAG: BlaI/MecI/CopY family transcriptional regulator, partial [Candidatus Methylomirabilales bacterium]
MKEKYTTVFRPHKRGLQKVFGELEAEIMETLWRLGKASVGEVVEVLRQEREIAYTTVKTVMGRLVEKGHLMRYAGEKAHLYKPVLSREAFLKQVGEEILESLFTDFGEPVLAHLVSVVKDQKSMTL